MQERRRARLSRSLLREAIPSLMHLVRFGAFVGRARFGPRRPAGDEPGWVAVVLSYRRPLNIEPIARAILRCRGCEVLIVSNNDPAIDIRRYCRVDDPRMRSSTRRSAHSRASGWSSLGRRRRRVTCSSTTTCS